MFRAHFLILSLFRRCCRFHRNMGWNLEKTPCFLKLGKGSSYFSSEIEFDLVSVRLNFFDARFKHGFMHSQCTHYHKGIASKIRAILGNNSHAHVSEFVTDSEARKKIIQCIYHI